MSPQRTPRPVRWTTIAIATVAITVAILCVGLPPLGLWLLSRSSGPLDGDEVARDRIESEAALLQKELGKITRTRNAETFAAGLIESEGAGWAPDGDSLQIEPVAWSGRTTGSERATIDVRFRATVVQRAPAGFGGRGTTAGSATTCVRYVLQLYRYTIREQIDCPDIAEPPIPVPEVVPALPNGAWQRLDTVLLSATPDSLAADVRAAFPAEFITVDTVTHGGELVAAVGVPQERDCVLAVRLVDGTVAHPGYDPIWLEPGELGCRVGLYTSPPR
jgi:hypothetical protein